MSIIKPFQKNFQREDGAAPNRGQANCAAARQAWRPSQLLNNAEWIAEERKNRVENPNESFADGVLVGQGYIVEVSTTYPPLTTRQTLNQKSLIK